MTTTGWTTRDLGRLIAELESGSRPKGGADSDSGEIPSLGGENIRSDGRLDLSSVRMVPRSFFENMTKGVLRKGDVLINKDGANTGKVGIYRNEYARASINEHVFRIRGRDDQLDQGFLFYFLVSQPGQEQIRGRISGSAQPGLKASFVDRLLIQVPPRFELQPLVAQVLSKVDGAIEQTEALLAKQQRIKAALMCDLLTRGIDAQGCVRDPATHSFKPSPVGPVPNEWKVQPLGDLAYVIDPNPSHRYPPPADLGVPIASTENFTGDDGYDLSFSSLVSHEVFDEQNRRCGYEPDVVIFARKGRMGFARPYGHDRKAFSHTVVAVKSKSDEVLNRYLLWTLRSQAFFRELHLQMNSNSGVPTLGIEFIETLRVAKPCRDEQAIIIRLIDGIAAGLRKTEVSLAKLRRLKTGLMQDLLTGRVPVTPLLAQREAIVASA
jgi:type I restriction enzyme S subunit